MKSKPIGSGAPRVVVSATVVAVATALTHGAPAHADAWGCTRSNDAAVNCIEVRSEGGSGPDITTVTLSRGKAVGATVCHPRFKVVVTSPNEAYLDVFDTGTIIGCSLAPFAAFRFDVYKVYPHNSRICGYLYEGEELTPGYPCERVLGRLDWASAPSSSEVACPVLLAADSRLGTSTADVWQDCGPYAAIVIAGKSQP